MSHADANRVYFDSISDTYDTNPNFARVNRQVTEAWREHVPWIKLPLHNVAAEGDRTEASTKPVRLLDYACGTGLMTNVFAPYITHATGIDISPNMLSAYNSRFQSHPHLTITTALANLLDASNPSPPVLSTPEFTDYDLAAVGFGFHHFDDATFAARQLKERLRPGGVLVINDFLDEGDGSGSHHHHHHHHHGHGHEHGESHHHHHDHHFSDKPDENQESSSDATKHDDATFALRAKMHASIVVPNFSDSGIRSIFSEAGFVDVDVVVLKEKFHLEIGGNKTWRTVFFAQGKRPGEGEMKSEL